MRTARAALKPPSKYGNRKVQVGEFTFDSALEARRYQELKLLEKSGAITALRVHPSWPLIVNGVVIGRYTGDFEYIDRHPVQSGGSKVVVEDCKGVKTRDYLLRKKLMLAIYGIAVREVTKEMVGR